MVQTDYLGRRIPTGHLIEGEAETAWLSDGGKWMEEHLLRLIERQGDGCRPNGIIVVDDAERRCQLRCALMVETTTQEAQTEAFEWLLGAWKRLLKRETILKITAQRVLLLPRRELCRWMCSHHWQERWCSLAHCSGVLILHRRLSSAEDVESSGPASG